MFTSLQVEKVDDGDCNRSKTEIKFDAVQVPRKKTDVFLSELSRWLISQPRKPSSIEKSEMRDYIEQEF